MSRKSRAQQVMNEYYSKLGPGPYYYDNSAVSAALREVINQLQQSPGVIMCADLLELCEELEDAKKEWYHPESGVASNDINLDGCYD